MVLLVRDPKSDGVVVFKKTGIVRGCGLGGLYYKAIFSLRINTNVL